MLRPEDRKAIEDMFAGAGGKVEALVLTRGEMPPGLHEALAEVAEVAPAVTVTERPWREDEDAALSELAPAVVLLDEDGEPTGVRFSGYPAGYEFGVLVQDLADVAHGHSGLSPAMQTFLDELKEPLAIKVFTTPT